MEGEVLAMNKIKFKLGDYCFIPDFGIGQLEATERGDNTVFIVRSIDNPDLLTTRRYINATGYILSPIDLTQQSKRQAINYSDSLEFVSRVSRLKVR